MLFSTESFDFVFDLTRDDKKTMQPIKHFPKDSLLEWMEEMFI